MERITIEEVKSAYESIGYKPQDYMWIDTQKKSCCALSAVALSREVLNEEQISKLGFDQQSMATATNFNVEYIAGFLCGFDGDTEGSWLSDKSEDFNIGFNDGKEVRKGILK